LRAVRLLLPDRALAAAARRMAGVHAVLPSAVTVEYWFSSSGSQLSSVRTDIDPSAWTWNSLPRLKNGTRVEPH
jgi:hypothetical protein